MKLAIRVKERLFRSIPRPPAVPSRPVNAACYQLCRLEQRLFRRRSPGFGTSILALATHDVRSQRLTPAVDAPML